MAGGSTPQLNESQALMHEGLLLVERDATGATLRPQDVEGGR